MAQKLKLAEGQPRRRASGPIDYSKFDDTALATKHWLMNYSDQNLTCRAQRHDFPVLVPGRALPKGRRRDLATRTERGREGQWQLVEFCQHCERRRVTTLLPGNELGPGVSRAYSDPKGYAKPKGLNKVTKTQAYYELLRRMAETGVLDTLLPLAVEG